jgi:TolB-like protein/Tfp pilus assembly protein PilF
LDNKNVIGFGRFQFDEERRELSRDGIPIKLGSRALDVLHVLAKANGNVVSKDNLLAEVWPGMVVEENNIQVHIAALRKAIDEGTSGQTHLVTIPGRGYRLVGIQPSLNRTDVKDARLLALPDKPSIAVLPFQNMSDDPAQDYFADGIVEDIITGLSRVKWFFVVARNSSFTYKGRAVDVKQVGRELGVRYVLEGSVRKASNRVRITAQLIESETGSHLWAERYDRVLDDIFLVQDEIAMSVVGAIEPTLRKAEIERVKRKRPESLDAYDLVLQALPAAYSMMADEATKAIPLLVAALKIDPDYVRAHALLAWCHHHCFTRGGLQEEDQLAAIRHARIASSGSSDDASALAISGLVIFLNEHNATLAQRLFDRALAISESDIFALSCSASALSWMGESETAIERAERAVRISPFDPMNFMAYDAMSVAYYQTKRYEEARDAACHAIESNQAFSVPFMLLAAALVRLGSPIEAKAATAQALALNPTFRVDAYRATIGYLPELFEAYAEAWREAGMPG